MRRNCTTAVNVQVNDRQDRTNVIRTSVVATLRGNLRRMCLFLRSARMRAACKAGTAWKDFAKQLGEVKQVGEAKLRPQAAYAPAAGSPSWGGHRSSGGPGTAHRS